MIVTSVAIVFFSVVIFLNQIQVTHAADTTQKRRLDTILYQLKFAKFYDDVSILGGLSVNGTFETNDRSSFAKAATFDGRATFNGNTEYNSTTTYNGSVTFNGRVVNAGSTTFNGAVNVASLGFSPTSINSVNADTISTGSVLYDADTSTLNVWNGSDWSPLAASGDIINYSFGDGLTLNGSSVTSTLGSSITTGEITDSTIGVADFSNMGCSTDQILKYNGTTWACASDDTSSGSTDYAAGTGLTLTGTTFSNNLGTSIDSSEITDATITNADVSSSAALDYSKLNLTNALVAGDLTTGAVTSAKILDGTITGSDLTDGTIDFDKISDSLTLDAASSITRTSTSTTENSLTFNLVNSGGAAGTDQAFVISNGVSTNTSGDITTEALLALDQADTTISGNSAVTDALLITNSGGSTLTNGITIGSGTQTITNALNIGSSGVTNVINNNGTAISGAEINRLDGKDAALVDANDVVTTAITGTGTLTSGATGSGFTLDITNSTVSGTLGVSNGGTGTTSLTSNGVLYGSGTSAVQAGAAGTSGQLLVANVSGVPTFVTASGDATLAADGMLTIGTGAVTSGKILDGTIADADHVDDTLDFDKIADSLTLDAATTVSRTSTSNENSLTLSYLNNGGSAGTDQVLILSNAVSTNTTGDLNTEALLLLDQADTTSTGTSILDQAIYITNSGGSTLTNGITIGTGTQAIATGLNIASTGVTTDFSMQNGETIDNNVDGTLALTATTTALSGGLKIGGGTTILKHLSGTATNLVSSSIATITCGAYGTITVTGAAVGDTVVATPDASSSATGIEDNNLSWSAYVSSTNTVTITACNPTLGSINAADDQEWRADVWQH